MKHLHIEKLIRLSQFLYLFFLIVTPSRSFGQYLLEEDIVSLEEDIVTLDGQTNDKYLHLGEFGDSKPFYTIPICFPTVNALQEYSRQIIKHKVKELTLDYIISTGAGVDPDEERKTFLFNSNGRIYEMYSSGNGAWDERIGIFRDENGRIQRVEERRCGMSPRYIQQISKEDAFNFDPNRIISYGYGTDRALNEIIVQTGLWPGHWKGDSSCFRVQYDKVGRVSEIRKVDANSNVIGRKLFLRDRRSNLTQIEETNNINDTKLVNKYSYDKYDRLVGIVIPLEGTRVKLAYNKSNQIIERWEYFSYDYAAKTLYTYDKNNLLRSFIMYGYGYPNTDGWDIQEYTETKIEYDSNDLPQLRESIKYYGGSRDLVTNKKIFAVARSERVLFNYKYSN